MSRSDRDALRVEGARQLRASLKAAGLDVQDLKDAHLAVAEMVRQESNPRAPRASGRLAADVRAAGTASAAIVRVGRASLRYAGPQHWGWPARGIKAKRWITDTVVRTEETSLRMYLHALETIIDTIEGAPGL